MTPRPGRLAPCGSRLLPHVTVARSLLADIEKVRRQGYATAPEEALLGVNVMAAPVRNYENKVVASVGLIGSVQHIAPSPDPSLIKRLLELSEGVSRALGMPDRRLP